MSLVVGFLLCCYALGVLSLAWHIRQTASLVGRDASISFADDGTDLPAIDIVVPVKDEEHNIGPCLRALIAENYPNVRIIVVNDRSTDGTARIVQQIQDEYPTIERVDIATLPKGVFGKPNAIDGVKDRFRGEFVLFVDSDMQIKPGCLSAVVRYMRRNQLDWFAAAGEPKLTHFWEKLLAPIFGAMAYAWYDPRNVSDPSHPDAIGSGFMMVRRDAYLAIGGHGAVKTHYDEDSALLRLAKAAGHSISFVISPNLFSVKLYGDLGRTVRGFSRTLIGGLKTFPRFFITIHALLFVSLMPYIVAGTVAVLAQFDIRLPWASGWIGFAALHWVLSNVLLWLIYRTARLPLHISLLHPIASATVILICIRAAADMRRGRPISWRGTSYPNAEPAMGSISQ